MILLKVKVYNTVSNRNHTTTDKAKHVILAAKLYFGYNQCHDKNDSKVKVN